MIIIIVFLTLDIIIILWNFDLQMTVPSEKLPKNKIDYGPHLFYEL